MTSAPPGARRAGSEPANAPIDLDAYRPNVGVVLFNSDGQVWLGRRIHTPGPFNWQFPQGGVDKGEDLLTAALRELQEETGVVSTRFLNRTDDWITYDFPEDYRGSKMARGWRGQKQVWFALRFTGPESEINLYAHRHVEFDDWRWASIEEAPELVVPFKHTAYLTVVEAFRRYAQPG